MVSEVFLRKKFELLKRIKKGTKLTNDLKEAIINTYGTRGVKALEAIENRRVIKRGNRWFIRGKSDEYEVVQAFCSCRDYVLNIVTEKVDADMCYHALAKRICEMLDAYYVCG